MSKVLRIGTRKSKLALWQANFVKEALSKRGIESELVLITTSGDKILDQSLSKIGGKGLFTKEIEEALLKEEIDIAVHSLKDMPAVLPMGLSIDVFIKRENPFDAFISKNGKKLLEIEAGSIIGTSSLRRAIQLKAKRKDIKVELLRGNVDTRIKKLDDGIYDAIILAVAGLKRMGYEKRITEILDFIPAVSQGIIGIEIRKDDKSTKSLIEFLNDKETEICARAERSFLKELGGGCQVPMGAFAKVEKDNLFLTGFVGEEDGSLIIRSHMLGSINNPEELGKYLANYLILQGADKILQKLSN